MNQDISDTKVKEIKGIIKKNPVLLEVFYLDSENVNNIKKIKINLA